MRRRHRTRTTTTLLTALAAVCGLLLATAPGAVARQHDRHEPRFVVSEAQFERMFPERDPFFTYEGLVKATASYPRFARTGPRPVRAREAAAFLANISHETGGLRYVTTQNPPADTCDEAQPYGCPAGEDAYYGRGAIMLSWNFNYKAAGDALGVDLLADPWLVERDPEIAWATALWYWNTQNGPNTMTAHHAMVHRHGFGETIRSLNGPNECDGANPEQMNHRVGLYRTFTHTLHTHPGRALTC